MTTPPPGSEPDSTNAYPPGCIPLTRNDVIMRYARLNFWMSKIQRIILTGMVIACCFLSVICFGILHWDVLPAGLVLLLALAAWICIPFATNAANQDYLEAVNRALAAGEHVPSYIRKPE